MRRSIDDTKMELRGTFRCATVLLLPMIMIMHLKTYDNIWDPPLDHESDMPRATASFHASVNSAMLLPWLISIISMGIMFPT
jgi:hypothetical protein